MRWYTDWAAAACPLVQPLSLCFVRLSTKSSIPRESLVSLILCQAQANTSSFTIFPGTSPTPNSQSQQSPACWRTRAPTYLKTKSSSTTPSTRIWEMMKINESSPGVLILCTAASVVWIYDEDPEPESQSKANNSQWGPNVKAAVIMQYFLNDPQQSPQGGCHSLHG